MRGVGASGGGGRGGEAGRECIEPECEASRGSAWGSAFFRLPTKCLLIAPLQYAPPHSHTIASAFPAAPLLLQCYVCKREGREGLEGQGGGDGSSEAEAVSKCIHASCGHYYHPRCIGAAEGEPFSW